MKLKSLLLLIIAIAVGGVAYYLSSSSKDGVATTNTYLVPGLAEKLNDVTKLTILEAENIPRVIISKAEKNWVVENRDGYEADIATVRTVFTNLAEAKLIETKTSNPDKYSRLGVEDISSPDAQGVQFAIEGIGESISIIAGNEGSTNKNTQYIRRAEDKQSWLVNKKLNIDKDVTQWLKKDILDIAPEKIKSIQIRHTDGSVISIENKGTEEYEFALMNALPEGKKVSESEVYQVANALSSLQLRDVASLEKLNEELVQSTITIYTTYDGLTVTAKTFSEEQDTYSLIEIEFNADHIDENNSISSEHTDPAMKYDPKAAEELALRTAPKLKGWAYVFPTITQDALVKKLDNFLLDEDV